MVLIDERKVFDINAKQQHTVNVFVNTNENMPFKYFVHTHNFENRINILTPILDDVVDLTKIVAFPTAFQCHIESW